MVSRYEQFVKEHRTFNDDQTKFLEWVAMVEEQLKALSEIVGDFAVLQVSINFKKAIIIILV